MVVFHLNEKIIQKSNARTAVSFNYIYISLMSLLHIAFYVF